MHRSMIRQTVVTALLCSACLTALVATQAAENMIGRQSQNEGILVVPAPGKVVVDGDLQDWDWSGRIWVFADTAVRDRYSVEAAAMWDKDYLYLAAKWKDPTPMFSLIDPLFNPDEGWKEDAWQMRILTDQPLWLTTWYFTTRKQPVLHIAYWKDPNNVRGGQTAVLLTAKDGGTDLGQGAAMAYRADADGKGYSQEIRIPWALLYKSVPEMKPGVTFRLGNEFLWGDPTGKTWPVHRYADNMQPGKTSREFYWMAKDVWGDATLVAKGGVPLRPYVSDTGRIAGTVPVRVTLPADAARFTVVLQDAAGNRVRTLAADCTPADYAVGADKGKTRAVEVKWDCLDDKGQMVAPGTYHTRGLTHTGLSAEYEMCYYNPGTPPWPTRDDRGAWGADHSAPTAAAAGADWTLVTWPVVEGGAGIIGIDPTGQKRWSDHRGITKVTADASNAYAYVTAWYTTETICRFDLRTGAMRPFILDGKERTFDLSLKEILGTNTTNTVTGMAAHNGLLVLALSAGKLAVLDAGSAAVRQQFDVPNPGEIAFSRDGMLYGLLDGRLNRIDLASGALTPIPTPGVAKPVALAADLDGNLLIADRGPDSQVKAFTPAGQPAYTCGRKGGRPIRGPFDPQAMTHINSVAVDAKGQVWVVESWNFPRRVSVWGKDGKLVRDYLGNTGYAGTACYLHDQDPTLAYCGPIEFKLDYTQNTWQVTQVLWVPDTEQGESFTIETGANELPRRFRSAASGKPHEYLYAHETGVEGTGHVVFMERDGRWQPVAAICMAGHISGKLAHNGSVVDAPSGEMAGLNAYDGVIWNDTNEDGKVQRSECTIVPVGQAAKGSRAGLPIGDGWGGRMGDDLSIYAPGITRYKPVRFTDSGAPVYSLDGKLDVGAKDYGDLVPVPGEDRLICLSMEGYAGPTKLTAVDLKTGRVEWYYPNPYPGVHGSHRAVMPKPGLLIGPLKTCGVAKMSAAIGSVFLMRGNLGQDFLMTTDCLFVGTLFQDTRLPAEGLPDKESQLRGMPLEGLTEGGEPFNGWFGRQDDGKVRLTTGMPRQAGMILGVNGLESIRRFEGGAITVDAAALVRADADNTARARKVEQPKTYAITPLRAAPPIDGSGAKWPKGPALTIAREGQVERATARIAYDATNLYVLVDVQDASPWRNAGKDLARLFKTGDAVDLQLAADPNANPKRANPAAGDLRVVLAALDGKPVAVLMAPVDKSAPAGVAKAYTSPVGTKRFDRVAVLANAKVAVKTQGDRYVVEASIPLQALGLSPKPGLKIRGDVGFISSDAAGLINTARTYWANPNTNLVNDEPLEAWLYPIEWGEFVFE